MYRLFFLLMVLISLFWALSSLAMVILGAKVVGGGLASWKRPSTSNGLTSGLPIKTGVVFIACGALLGIPMLSFACWGLTLVFNGGL